MLTRLGTGIKNRFLGKGWGTPDVLTLAEGCSRVGLATDFCISLGYGLGLGLSFSFQRDKGWAWVGCYCLRLVLGWGWVVTALGGAWVGLGFGGKMHATCAARLTRVCPASALTPGYGNAGAIQRA
jgi:hypothetical protein